MVLAAAAVVVVVVKHNTFPPHSAAAAAAGDNSLLAEADNILVAGGGTVAAAVVVGPGRHSRLARHRQEQQRLRSIRLSGRLRLALVEGGLGWGRMVGECCPRVARGGGAVRHNER